MPCGHMPAAGTLALVSCRRQPAWPGGAEETAQGAGKGNLDPGWPAMRTVERKRL